LTDQPQSTLCNCSHARFPLSIANQPHAIADWQTHQLKQCEREKACASEDTERHDDLAGRLN
jgi:hypothetical protein